MQVFDEQSNMADDLTAIGWTGAILGDHIADPEIMAFHEERVKRLSAQRDFLYDIVMESMKDHFPQLSFEKGEHGWVVKPIESDEPIVAACGES